MEPAPAPAEPRDPHSVQGIIAGLLDAACQYVDGELSPARGTATDYYHGRPFGNEEDGLSKVVSTDVRDAILRIMPSLLRVFFGPQGAVEYVATRGDQEAAARQATGYANYLFLEDNDGFLLTHSVLKDGLLKKIGVAKSWWEDTSTSETYQLTGLTSEAVAILADDPSVTLGPITVRGEYMDVEVTRTAPNGCVRVVAVPPEELIFSADARSPDEAVLIGHRREATVAELVALGFDAEAVRAFRGPTEIRDNPEALARFPTDASLPPATETEDAASERVSYCEAYVRMDMDGDQRPTLRRFHAFGTGWTLLSRTGEDPERGELVEDHPFTCYVMDPEPHTMLGLSMFDYAGDVQKIKSSIQRGMNDSLNMTLHPRTWAVMGQVEAQDVLNVKTGAVIRCKQPGMVGEFTHEFVGKEALAVLSLYDDVLDSRTGATKIGAGLDADSLQSSTKLAVAGTFGAAYERKELLARLFAETFLKPLFTRILRLLKQHQQHPRTVKIKNEYVTVDPRTWGDMGVRVTVALGAGLTEDKMAHLLAIKQDQDAILAQFGLANPLVSLAQAYETRARLIELQGFPNPEAFYTPISPEQAAQLREQAAQQPPTPPPEVLLAQMEAQKAQSEIQLAQARLALEQQKAIWEHELQEERLRQELALKSREMELKYQAEINEAELQRFVDGHKAALDATLATQKAELQAATDRYRAELQAEARAPSKES